MRGKASEIKSSEMDYTDKLLTDRYVTKARINLNDLLKQRSEEKKKDKKNNLIIFSGVAAVSAVVLIILSL